MSSKPGGPNPQMQQAQQMFNSLSQGRKVALVAAAVGLVFSFFHWYGVSASFGTQSVSASISGWHGWGLLAILCYILTGALVLLPFAGISVRRLIPTLPPTATDGTIVMGLGIVATLSVVLFILTEGSGQSVPGYSEGASFGAYIGLIAAVAIAAGGYLMRQQESAV